MSNLLLPRRFYNQPQGAVQIDKSRFTPVAAIKGDDRFGVDGAAFVVNNPTDVQPWIDAEVGTRFMANTLNTSLNFPTARTMGDGFTVVVRWKNLDGSPAKGVLCSGIRTWNEVGGFFVYMQNANTLQIRGGTATFQSKTITNIAATDGVINTLALKFTGTRALVGFNGFDFGEITGIGAAGATPHGIAFGNYVPGGSSSEFRNHVMYLGAVVYGGDHLSLSANPWQIFKVSE